MDLDDVTRARLERTRENYAESEWTELRTEDYLALLAAYDALRAERDQHQCPQYKQHHHSRLLQLRRVMAERDALLAEQAQAARVLAAVDGWFQRGHSYPEYDAAEQALRTAYHTWRAAREG